MNKLIAFIFSARWSATINIVLAAVLGYNTVQLLLLLNTVPPTFTHNQYDHSVSNINQLQLSTPTTVLNISALLKTHLFGNSQITAMQNATQMTNTPPDTKLNLKLHGIYHSSNISLAMIAAGKGKSKLYHVDDTLPGGTVLHQINPKKVILLRNGRYETLRLVGTQNSRINQLEDIHAKNVQGVINPNDNIRPETLLCNYQRQLKTDPSRLMKLVRISPVKRSGRLIGYRLRPRKDAKLLSRFNLQSGDILTAINGIKLDSPLKGLGVVQQLATTNQVDLQILRNGQMMSLSFMVEK